MAVGTFAATRRASAPSHSQMASLAVHAGTNARRAIRVGAYEVSKVDFAEGRELPWHSHPRACVAVVVRGRVSKRFASLAADAGVGTLVSMPPEEEHEDRFGREGSSIVVVESADGVDQLACFRDWHALLIGLRIVRELTIADRFSALAIEGLALELCALAARGRALPRAAPWLRQARELLGERFSELPTAVEIASEIGVHPVHLARAFRAQYGESLGGCVRRLRLEWAAERLVQSDVPLVSLARDAGFVDQSHFTRAFRKQFGTTPGRYRAAFR